MSQFLVFFWIFISTTQSYILPTNEEFHNNHKLDWNSAESYCLSKYNSHLLSIHDTNTFQQLRRQIISINQNMNHFWIGLVNIATNNNEINYTWSDSTPFNFGINIDSHTFPWFDERPESPSKDKYVRLWGGSASLLWDDTNPYNKYFWICNNNKTMNRIPIINNNNHNESINNNNNNNTDSLDTFWKFLLFAVLTLSLCILLLRIRTIYKNYVEKHKKSSIGSTVITDLSFVDSSNRKSRTTTNIPALHFSSVDNRDDSDSINKCKRILISPFSNSQSLLSIPQIPQIPIPIVNENINHNINYSQINLEIEHNINQNNNQYDCNMSIAATFDINTYLNDETDNDNDCSNNGEEYRSCSSTFSSSSSSSSDDNGGRTQSIHSTMAAFDVNSFKMKADEFKFCDIYMENNININTNNNIGISNENICDDEFIVSGETSDDYKSFQSETETRNTQSINNINITKLDAEKSQLSEKEMEIKANSTHQINPMSILLHKNVDFASFCNHFVTTFCVFFVVKNC